MHICSFSGLAADLPTKDRNDQSVLSALARDPKVSTWDMSELVWLRQIIERLKHRKLIRSLESPYPWRYYEITDKGKKQVEPIEC